MTESQGEVLVWVLGEVDATLGWENVSATDLHPAAPSLPLGLSQSGGMLGGLRPCHILGN